MEDNGFALKSHTNWGARIEKLVQIITELEGRESSPRGVRVESGVGCSLESYRESSPVES